MLDKNKVPIDIPESTSTMRAGASGNASAVSHDIVMLFPQHVREKTQRFQKLLNNTGYQALIIASGSFKTQFQDDLFYPFKANPYFKEWLPLNKRRDAFLVITLDAELPTLLLDCAEDIWHTAPQSLPEGFEKPFKVIEYTQIDTVHEQLKTVTGKVALIAECNNLNIPEEDHNPVTLLQGIDFQRRNKTAYEQACVRQASHLAAPAHLAARDAFLNGASEYDIANAYLQACRGTENEMPYGIIAGVNQNAAVLHHYELNKQPPPKPLSFLIDAGVDYHGYASDISRTYSFDSGSDFAAMIALLNSKQLALVAAGAIGRTPLELHIDALRAIAEILIEFNILNTSVDAAIKYKIIETFFPHSLGHHLGVNVHDKGAQLASAQGDVFAVLQDYPKMRQSAPMVSNQIYTVEPGLYFIPGKLQALREGEHGRHINWSQVEHFMPYGGIRVEDNIVLHSDGRKENLTRDAFASLGVI
jgi:Xaa-Pro dipeptidase